MTWTSGYATHYGPFPSVPYLSEIGYQPNNVGVGCSNGIPGGDPRFKEILDINGSINSSDINRMVESHYDPSISKESIQSSLQYIQNTVWPRAFTVAVSERAYGGPNKELICYQPLKIRNANNKSIEITAYVVDFCPSTGCHWTSDQQSSNVDIYGQHAWTALNGGLLDARLQVEIQWPSHITPNSRAHSIHASLHILFFTFFIQFFLQFF